MLHIEHKKLLSSLGRLAGSAKLILDAFFEYPIASISKLAKRTGLTAATAGRLLIALEDDYRSLPAMDVFLDILREVNPDGELAEWFTRQKSEKCSGAPQNLPTYMINNFIGTINLQKLSHH